MKFRRSSLRFILHFLKSKIVRRYCVWIILYHLASRASLNLRFVSIRCHNLSPVLHPFSPTHSSHSFSLSTRFYPLNLYSIKIHLTVNSFITSFNHSARSHFTPSFWPQEHFSTPHSLHMHSSESLHSPQAVCTSLHSSESLHSPPSLSPHSLHALLTATPPRPLLPAIGCPRTPLPAIGWLPTNHTCQTKAELPKLPSLPSFPLFLWQHRSSIALQTIS